MSYFQEGQRGGPSWDKKRRVISMNRTEALDMSRTMVRERRVTLDRECGHLREFAAHMACDAKVLEGGRADGTEEVPVHPNGCEPLLDGVHVRDDGHDPDAVPACEETGPMVTCKLEVPGRGVTLGLGGDHDRVL
jgi:hypothetical protein